MKKSRLVWIVALSVAVLAMTPYGFRRYRSRIQSQGERKRCDTRAEW